MDESQNKQNHLVETTDCLEAVGVFKGWKNFLFIIVLLCLLLVQVSFWLVDTGYVKPREDTESVAATPSVSEFAPELNEVVGEEVAIEPDDVQEAAKTVAADQNVPAGTVPEETKRRLWDLGSWVKFEHLTWVVRFVNFILIVAGALYCLTMLFTLKVSMLGRLGGINHISRAFFLSLTLLVLLLPWQDFFGGAVKGAIYTPKELTAWMEWYAARENGIFGTVLYYLRFTGYWVVVVVLLIFAQLRSNRWARAILRRLEVI
jgi:hypothetical protein